MYPDEMDILYGDAILFKVVSKALDSSNVSHTYEIVDMLTDPMILDQFFDHYMPTYGVIDFVPGNLSPIDVSDECSSSESQFSNEKKAFLECKRKVGAFDEFTAESTGNNSNKYSKIL
jgi:hypothetical protein